MNLKTQLNSWYEPLKDEFNKQYIKQLQQTIKQDRLWGTVFPNPNDVFNAFRLTPFESVKVCIIGQNPYHTAGMANGLAFSVNPESKKIPPSLINIFKELEDDLGFKITHNPDLTRWAKQGVFLLNTSLTVKEGLPNSHLNIGWEIFTKQAVYLLAQKQQPVLFLLWGTKAQAFCDIIKPKNYLCSAHPSPFSAYRGFFGSKPFSRANRWLIKHNIEPIDWLIDE